MSDRAPFQVLVMPFRKAEDGTAEYAALRRSDHDYWQGIAGGGEGSETPLEAARRESMEEAGLPLTMEMLALDTISSVPLSHFPTGCDHWPAELLVLPEHCFAVDCTGRDLKFSNEHNEIRWGTYEEVHGLFRWDSNRTALWELATRLAAGLP